uniref:Uncharacterized protein n=1 Tax=Canis lupus dingo TaxID=286419 RepID=A0A8C0JRE3_CANLU
LETIISSENQVEFGKLCLVGFSLNSVSDVEKKNPSGPTFQSFFTWFHIAHCGWTQIHLSHLSERPTPPLYHLHPNSILNEKNLISPSVCVGLLVSDSKKPPNY